MISKYLYNDLPSQIKNELNSQIDLNFGAIPIVKTTSWARPDWSVIKFVDQEVVSFFNIIERDILIDKKTHKAAGINNVITPQKYRGRGYSSQILNNIPGLIFEELNVEVGLLLCADELIAFYEKLDWYVVECPVYCLQPQGKIEWNANTMLLSRNNKIKPEEIDLNGLPW